MRKHRFYRTYPASDVDNLGGNKGFFEDLQAYCALGFDKKGDVSHLCSHGLDDSLFVWDDECMGELRKKDGELKSWQLRTVAYMWELCYDLLLAKEFNVSREPGFEALGLRVNNPRKRKRGD